MEVDSSGPTIGHRRSGAITANSQPRTSNRRTVEPRTVEPSNPEPSNPRTSNNQHPTAMRAAGKWHAGRQHPQAAGAHGVQLPGQFAPAAAFDAIDQQRHDLAHPGLASLQILAYEAAPEQAIICLSLRVSSRIDCAHA